MPKEVFESEIVFMPYHTSAVKQFLATIPERIQGQGQSIEIGESWGKLWDCAWFHFTGTVPQTAAGQNVVLLIDLNGEGCVFDTEGSPVLGLTTVPSTFNHKLGNPGKSALLGAR